MCSVKKLFFLLSMVCTYSAYAADQASGYTVGALGDLNSQTIIANAQLALKQAQEKLNQASANSPNGPVTPPVIHEVAGTALPNVTTIMGDEAQFLFAGGTSASGHVGSTLPGGFKILSISFSDRTVTVKDAAGRMQILSMSSSAPVALGDQATNGLTMPQGVTMGAPIMPRTFH